MLEEAELVPGEEPLDGEVVVREYLEKRVEGAASQAKRDVFGPGVEGDVLHEPREQFGRLLPGELLDGEELGDGVRQRPVDHRRRRRHPEDQHEGQRTPAVVLGQV